MTTLLFYLLLAIKPPECKIGVVGCYKPEGVNVNSSYSVSKGVVISYVPIKLAVNNPNVVDVYVIQANGRVIKLKHIQDWIIEMNLFKTMYAVRILDKNIPAGSEFRVVGGQ